jgi:hypothetical protein
MERNERRAIMPRAPSRESADARSPARICAAASQDNEKAEIFPVKPTQLSRMKKQ